MAHVPVDPGSIPALETVQFLLGGSAIDEFPLIKAAAGRFERNRSGYQSWGQDDQFAAGDGRRIVGERSIDVLVQAQGGLSAHARLHQLSEALDACTALRYQGAVFPVAGSRGVSSVSPLGVSDLRVSITYLPAAQAGDIGGVPVLGPL